MHAGKAPAARALSHLPRYYRFDRLPPRHAPIKLFPYITDRGPRRNGWAWMGITGVCRSSLA